MRDLTLGTLRARITGGADREGGGSGPVVVLMHGFGAPGTDLVPLWRELQVPEEVRFVFPEAPLVVDRNAPPDHAGRAWWHIDIALLQRRAALGAIDALLDEIPNGIAEARSAVVSLLDALEAELGVPSERVIIGGFSQGSMLATDVVLRSERPFAGLAILSGTLIARREWQALMPKRAGLPVLQSHGRADPILPFSVASELHAALSAAGLNAEFVPFNGGHGIPGLVLERLAAFLRAQSTP
jgi:phospholipase/carboxylesterase